MSERNNTGWWLVEPPDHDLEPPTYTDSSEYRMHEMYDEEWIYEADIEAEDERRRRELALAALHELHDATQPLDLFDRVKIHDSGDFIVPERFLQTPHHGIWCFSIVGHVNAFKDRDSYGDVRFLAKDGKANGAIWVPHLYPFEETDSKGLPAIRDRERAELSVTLTRLAGRDLYPSYAEITTDGKLYGASNTVGYLAFDGSTLFTEFHAVGQKLLAETVEYPEVKWPTMGHYLQEKGMTQKPVGNALDDESGLREFLSQHDPLDWRTRHPSPLEGTAFGSIWVPIDRLNQGIDANIIFPTFKNMDDNTV